ncbi:MAG: TMEM175 family protein [Candidatus Tumulicola sp.]
MNGDERTLHRLEAFSDIVIGFCIAEMGLNLVVPKTAAQLPSIVIGTDGFVTSFVLIAIVWWIHHRVFKSIFVLNTAMVIVNFAMLGALVLMVYFQQICVHLIAIGDDVTVAVQLWLVSYSVVYALVAVMLWYGLRVRWRMLSEDDLRWAFGRAALVSLGSLIFIAYALIFKYRVHSSELFLILAVVIVAARFAVNGVVSRVISRRAPAVPS